MENVTFFVKFLSAPIPTQTFNKSFENLFDLWDFLSGVMCAVSCETISYPNTNSVDILIK